MHMFSNIIGVFVFDSNFNVVDRELFGSVEDYENKNEAVSKVKGRHKNLQEPDLQSLAKILLHFKGREFFSDFRSRNLQMARLGVKCSATDDTLLIQAVSSIGELDKAIGILVQRLREWYELYNPEFSRATENNEEFVEGAIGSEKAELLEALKVNANDSIGADFGQESLEPLRSLAHQVHGMYQLRKSQLAYISELMDRLCPNVKAVCDIIVGAKLVEHAGSLKRLSEMPASTIQVLGAEKALFRHMKTGAKSPKHGVIARHTLIAGAPAKMHGRIARKLADKISIAAKVDYFHGKFIGAEFRKELEQKFPPEK